MSDAAGRLFMKIRRRRRGTAIIEFVMMLPFYCTTLFGAIEFGQIFYVRVQLTNACKEGVRRVAVGKTLAEIRTTTQNTAPDLQILDEHIVIEYNTSGDGTGTWASAADNAAGTSNDVTSGLPCRVTISGWKQPLITGSYFYFVPGVSNGKFAMEAEEMMIRE